MLLKRGLRIFRRELLCISVLLFSLMMTNVFSAIEETEVDADYHVILDLGGTAIAFGDQEYEMELYKRALEELKDVCYDLDFVKLCNHAEYIVDGEHYKDRDFYLRIRDNGEVYFSNLRDKDVNLFTGEKMAGELVSSMRVSNSTMFYDLYTDGIVTENPIIVDKDIFLEYKDKWDGKMHDKTHDNAIELKIAEYVRGE